MMEQQRIATFLSRLEDHLADKLYRFSDRFFDDSTEKTDFMDTKSIEFIIRNSGVAYLVIRKESSSLFMFLSEAYRQIPSYAGYLKTSCKKVINKISFRILEMYNNSFTQQKPESETEKETDTEAYPVKISSQDRILLVTMIAGFLTRKITKAHRSFRNQNPVKTFEHPCLQSQYHFVPG